MEPSRRDVLRAMTVVGSIVLPIRRTNVRSSIFDLNSGQDNDIQEIIAIEDYYKAEDRDISDEELEFRLLPLWLQAFSNASGTVRTPGPSDVRFYRASHGDLPIPGGNVNIDMENKTLSIIHIHRLKSSQLVTFGGVDASGIEWMRWMLFHELGHWEIESKSDATLVPILNDLGMRQRFSFTDPDNNAAGTRLILSDGTYNIGFGIATRWESTEHLGNRYGLLFVNMEEQFADVSASIASDAAGLNFQILTKGAPELKALLPLINYPIHELREHHRASDVRGLAERLAVLDPDCRYIPVRSVPFRPTDPDYTLKVGLLKIQLLHERGFTVPPLARP